MASHNGAFSALTLLVG